jgi:hypothetical protein
MVSLTMVNFFIIILTIYILAIIISFMLSLTKIIVCIIIFAITYILIS